MFKPLFAAAAALVCMTGDVTVGKAHAYSVACGETSSVLELNSASLQMHKGGSVTFWSRNSSGSLVKEGRGSWTASRNGDVRITASNGKSHVFNGLFNESCDRMF